jgi:predicted permease
MRRVLEGWRRLRGWWHGAALDRRLSEEVAFHVDRQTEKNRQAGLTPAESRRLARVMFGHLEHTKERAREESRPARAEATLRDLRYAVRTWRRTPGFTSIAVLTIALGIGAATAVFTVLNGVLLQPLPYRDADRLVDLQHLAPGLDIPGGTVPLAATQLFSYLEHSRVFETIGLWTQGTATVTSDGDPEQVPILLVTHGTLESLAEQPARGRAFSPADDAPGSPETVLLAHGFWQRRFGADPAVVGRTLTVDGRPRQIVGVMSSGFAFLDRDADLILPFRFDRARLMLGGFNNRGVARLTPGVTIADANADAARIIPLWLQAWPSPAGLDRAIFESARFTPAFRPLKDFVVGETGELLWVLMGSVVIVLLVAAANVANLLLVRAEGRQSEMAMRSALGAGRGQLVRGLLLETLVLSGLGGAVGLGLAIIGVRLLVAEMADTLPRAAEISADPLVLVFVIAVSASVGLVFGLVTALRHASPDLSRELRDGGRAATGGRERRRAQSALVVTQVALAALLLVASGLMLRSFVELTHVDPGIARADHLQQVRITIPQAVVSDAAQVFAMQRDIRARLADLPGVEATAFSSAGPLQPAGAGDPVQLEHVTYAANQIPPIRAFKFISPGYFAAAGTSLVAGRDLSWDDIHSRRPVVVISEALAREGWGSAAAAIGGRVTEYPGSPWREVVGVARDVRDGGLHEPAPATVYWPALVAAFQGQPVRVSRSVAFVLRTDRAGTESLLAEIRQAVRAVNGSLPVAAPRTVRDVYDRALAATSVTLAMLGIAATMALLLSLVGIYGVLSYAVARRAREIGIRTALGAGRGSLRAGFVLDGLRLGGLGIVVGLAGALLAMQMMESLLVGVSALDPATYAAAAVVLVAAAAAASYVPAHRATSISPVEVLRAP